MISKELEDRLRAAVQTESIPATRGDGASIYYQQAGASSATVLIAAVLAEIDAAKPKPVTVSGWVNVYPRASVMGTYLTRAEAEQEAGSDSIACIYVKGTEGDEPE